MSDTILIVHVRINSLYSYGLYGAVKLHFKITKRIYDAIIGNQ